MDISADHWLDEHGNALYRFALMRLRDSQAAEEVVQETLLAALQAKDRYAGTSSVRTWLIGILKYKIIDHFRQQAREVQIEEPDELPDQDDDVYRANFTESENWRERWSDWGNPEQMLASREFMEILQICLDGLPKRLARLFVLREVMEESTEEICQEMSISQTNLWTMLHRTRLGLRQCLDKKWGTPPRE